MIKSRWPKFLIGAAVALVVAIAMFDWNWLRGPLERYLAEKSGREVRIGGLHLTLGLEPTVRLRDVYVQNAAWADDRPMAVAREVAFTFSLRSLWDERILVSRIALIDADIDMERQADGLRNWRLTEPDYRGPPKIRVLALEARDSKLRFLHRGIELDLATAASAPAPGDVVPTEKRPLTTRVDFNGSYRGSKFSGTALTGNEVTFWDTGKSIPLLGHMQWGGTKVLVDGSVADIMYPSAMEVKLRLSGASLAGLHPFVHFRPPATRPYVVEGKLTLADNEYAFGGGHGKIGGTDMTGEGSYRRDSPGTPRPMLRAVVRSDSADLADFGSLPGTGGRSSEAERVLPSGKFETERLRSTDAHLTLDAKKFKARGVMALESLRFTAALDDGVLQMKPIDLGIAGGHAVGFITADARGTSMSSRASIDFRGVRLEKLLPETAAATRSAGSMTAHLDLAGQGDSIATLLGNAAGTFAATLDHGRISNLADAKLALNGGKILAAKFRGDQDIDIRCAAVAIDFRGGTGHSRTLLLDTEQTRTDGTASIDLRAERFDVLLTPRPKKRAFFALDASIRAQGSFKDAHVSIDKRAVQVPRGGDGPCAAVLAEAR